MWCQSQGLEKGVHARNGDCDPFQSRCFTARSLDEDTWIITTEMPKNRAKLTASAGKTNRSATDTVAHVPGASQHAADQRGGNDVPQEVTQFKRYARHPANATDDSSSRVVFARGAY